tara:strand:+ start:126 stop:1118 length:993 start_codon:yes stop_codon:yes gene_type:complete
MFCKAPFNNMYFNTKGNVAPCWKLPGALEDWSPDRSMKDIWTGEHFNKYRDALTSDTYLNRCKECKQDVDNDVWPLAKAYEDMPIQDYPSMLELEMSNKCNLECIMCNADLSSGLARKQGLPLLQPYDESFKDQIKEFIPHLKELRFNGGEPFAQELVLQICDEVIKLNPDLPISIATNGTVLNKRVKYLMKECKIQINVSIDSLIPNRYAKIRVNGKLDKVLNNLEVFKEYCKTYNRQLSIMVNPMRNNWEEMPKFLDFVEEHDVKLWFNTVLYPENLSIWNLPAETMQEIYQTLSFETKTRGHMKEHHKLNHLVEDQIKNWMLDSYAR